MCTATYKKDRVHLPPVSCGKQGGVLSLRAVVAVVVEQQRNNAVQINAARVDISRNIKHSTVAAARRGSDRVHSSTKNTRRESKERK